MSTREYIERILAAEEDKLPADYVHEDLHAPTAATPKDISYDYEKIRRLADLPAPAPAPASISGADSSSAALGHTSTAPAQSRPSLMSDAELRENLLKAMAEKCNLREDQMANVLLQIQQLVTELPAEELRVFRRTYGTFV